MKKNLILAVLLTALSAGCTGTSNSKECESFYVFSYFVDQADGLHLAWSTDGLQWTPIAGGKSLLRPEIGEDKLMRDPSICQGPDGVFHMVWTTSWWDRIIGHASSTDLIHWSAQQSIPVMMHEPDARNCWAPEVFYDSDTEYFYIFWATTIPGRHSAVAETENEKGMNHRIYYTRTRDFVEFTPTEIMFNPDFSVIDAAIVRNPSDGELMMFLKNENPNPPQKNIRVTRSKSMNDLFPTEVSEPIHGDFWAEGPSPLFTGKDTLIVYYDRFADGCYAASRSLDGGYTWTDIPDEELSFPEGIRHGTAFKVSGEILEGLKKLQPIDVPDFAIYQGIETAERFREWKGDDEVVVFPILTDVHAHDRDTWRHIGYTAALDRYFNYDFMANLGDIGLNLGISHDSKAHSDSVVMLTASQMALYPGVFLYAPGNHDWDAGEGEFNSEQFLSDTFQLPSKKIAGENLHLTPGKCYGWYDVPQKNTRIIFLNSEATGTRDGFYYLYGDEQMKWLRKLLKDTDSKTDIVLLSHYMPHPQGRWNNIPDSVTFDSNTKMMALLAEFQPKRQIAGLFTGDSHVNLLEEKDGVHYFITQSYGWCSQELMMEGQRHIDFDFNESLCCDIIAVKPAKNEVHTFRIGAGGKEYDYSYRYGR